MDYELLMKLHRLQEDVGLAILAHERRAATYFGQTLNEREALGRLAVTIAALEREDSFPLSGTAA